MASTKHDRAWQIERWFARHADGDFVFADRDSTYAVLGPASRPGPIIYTTKRHAIGRAIGESRNGSKLGLIAHRGLPHAADLTWIRKVVAGQRVFFLGDLDPADLLIFAWLRLRLRPTRLTHLGISDSYLAALKAKVPPSFHIRYSPTEEASLRLLAEAFADWPAVVGPQCAALVEQQKKIELEAVVSALGSAGPLLGPVLKPPRAGRAPR